MQGPALLRARTVAYLASVMPPAIDLARTQWGLTALQLPYPLRYDAADPYVSNEYPIVGMYLVSDRDYIHRDFSAAAEREYSTRYTCRLFVSVITPRDNAGEYLTSPAAYEETIRSRDNLKTVLVNVLLSSPSMGGHDLEVLEETITTDYDQPMRVSDGMPNVYVSSAVVNADITMTESLYLPSLGTADTAILEVVSIPTGEEI